MSLALPAALLFRAVYALNPAVSRPKVVMALQLGGLVLKLALSEVLIFGQMGLPRLGAVGADAAVAAVALSLIGYFAGLHVFDALQGAAAAVLGAYRIAVMPMLIYALALWGPGLIGGYLVAFRPVLGQTRGVEGLWLMLMLALATLG